MGVLQNTALPNANALAIRDTLDHYSNWLERGTGVIAALHELLLAAASSLNEAVNITIQGARDAAGADGVWDIGTGNPDISIAASDGTVLLTGSAYTSQPWPFLRVKMTCAVAPTLGEITVYQIG